ncbi:MAG: GNAT family N-acetyltransferase, partial [Gammaproteobacteria bacterium]|nr:GNAT family N-acetyltransferase [Gammaproteobacteria bacterium]
MNRELANLPGDAGDGLCTARLRLRRFDVSDLPLLQRLNADPEVMRHLGGPKDSAATATMLERRILAYYQQH